MVVSPEVSDEGGRMEQGHDEMTAREASRRLGIRIASVYNALWDGLLEGQKDERGTWLINAESIERYRLRRTVRRTTTRTALRRDAIDVNSAVVGGSR